MFKVILFFNLLLLCPFLMASQSPESNLTLLAVQQQAASVFHAKRTFRFESDLFEPSGEEGRSALHFVRSTDLGLSCNLSSRGGFYPDNAYTLNRVSFLEDQVVLTFETIKNLFLAKAFATVRCVPTMPSDAHNVDLENLLISDFIEFFGAIEELNPL